ncbi:MAG: hypothetical protein AAFY25_14045 [Pseudomonadota bacterium]
MSRMKTLAAALLLTSSPPAAGSDTASLSATTHPNLMDTMTVCAGRMSAEMEFAWLLSDPDADWYQTQRLRFLDILTALGPAPDPSHQLALRIDAKMAHAGLLTTAHFGTDATRAMWAKRHAVQQRMTCQTMLLDS